MKRREFLKRSMYAPLALAVGVVAGKAMSEPNSLVHPGDLPVGDELAMDIRILDFEAEHIQRLRPDSIPDGWAHLRDPKQVLVVKDLGPTFSFEDGDKIVLCGGIYRFAEHQGELWTLFCEDGAKYFETLHPLVSHYLMGVNLQRYEFVLPEDDSMGHIWAELLDFKREKVMKGLYTDGHDAILYARVQ